MKPVRIPQRIDEPPHVLLWSMDELVPILIGLVLGVVLNHALVGTLAGMGLARLYRRFRDNRPDGYLLHLLWSTGFWRSGTRSMKNPYQKEFFE